MISVTTRALRKALTPLALACALAPASSLAVEEQGRLTLEADPFN